MKLEEKQVSLYQKLDFADLSELLHQIRYYFGCPVLFMDGNLNALMEEQMGEVEPLRPRLKVLHPLRQLRPEHPIAVVGQDNENWLLGAIFRQQLPVVFVAACRRESSWSQEDLTLTKTLLHVLELWLNAQSPRKMLYRRTSSTYINFFIELLMGKISGEVPLDRRLSQLGMVPPEEFCILTVDFEAYRDSDIALFLISELITEHFRCPMFAFYEEKLTFLLDTKVTPIWQEENEQFLRKKLETLSLRAGCSLSCGDLLQCTSAYADAQKSMELGRRLHPEEVLYEASRYMTYIMIEMATERLTITKHINPALITLMEYDQAHQTELLRTLYVYYRHLKDPAACAEELNVHKNTFFYRLNQIRSMLQGASLEDGEVVMQMMMSYHIMFFNGLLPELPM